VSVGFIGYPNTGKSSIINTLRKKVVCKTAPIPGETKIWQYITLTRRIYLIDCPGVVPPNPNDSDAELLMRGVVRVENVQNPSQYVATMLQRCQKRHVERTYGIKDWKDDDDFLEILARKSGRLLKGGDADADGVAKMVLNDFLRGRVPWYIPPPKVESDATSLGDREGALGEKNVGRKRKREEGEENLEGLEDGRESEMLSDSDSVAASDDSLLDESEDEAIEKEDEID
jgi:nuclear GTP-binding protein